MEERIVERLWERFRDENLSFGTPRQTANARNIWFSAAALVFAEVLETPDSFEAVRAELLEFMRIQKPRKLQ